MTSLVYDIGERPRKVSRFISHVRSELQSALIGEKKVRKLTQQAIAKMLGVNRSVINRQFVGTENLTLRSVADLAWALGYDIDFKLRKNEVEVGDNYSPAQEAKKLQNQITESTVPKITSQFSAAIPATRTEIANAVLFR
jgi:plasmid maintenance system antidote protein VapI